MKMTLKWHENDTRKATYRPITLKLPKNDTKMTPKMTANSHLSSKHAQIIFTNKNDTKMTLKRHQKDQSKPIIVKSRLIYFL